MILSYSQVCVAAIAQTECILSLKKCMENERDLIATCCETLTRLFKCQHVSIYAHTGLLTVMMLMTLIIQTGEFSLQKKYDDQRTFDL